MNRRRRQNKDCIICKAAPLIFYAALVVLSSIWIPNNALWFSDSMLLLLGIVYALRAYPVPTDDHTSSLLGTAQIVLLGFVLLRLVFLVATT